MKEFAVVFYIPGLLIIDKYSIKSIHYDLDYADTILTYEDGSTLRIRGNHVDVIFDKLME